MERARRVVLKGAGATGALAAALAAGLLKPGQALAAWNKGAFDAKTTADAMIDITSNIPGTTSISVFVEKNPFPYTGTFDVSQGALPFVHLRIKIGESSPVRVVVAAGGKYFTTAKEVKVTIGGCGG